jgi:GNAT superfamily N-acetyltransferase
MNITVAQAADLPELAAMLAEFQKSLESVTTIDEAKNTRYLKQILKSEKSGTVFIGHTSSHQPAAFAIVCHRLSSPDADSIPHILDLYVRESFRRKGFGRQLFDHVVRWAKSKKYAQLCWQVENLNLTAQYMFDTYNPAITGWVGYSLDLRKEPGA